MKKNIEKFQKDDYCIVKSAVSDELRDFVTQYTLFDEMQDFTPDGSQVPTAHSKYGDPTMEAMLLHLHTKMEENTGLSLFPTYSFYRVYRKGDELTVHKDRPSCEISCTLCFNHSYDREDYKWPIFMDGNQADLEPGDMVIYRGCDLDHWRDPFDITDNEAWHVQGFFHYVDANGPYTDHKFDQRNSIGDIDKNKIRENNLNNKIDLPSYISYS